MTSGCCLWCIKFANSLGASYNRSVGQFNASVDELPIYPFDYCWMTYGFSGITLMAPMDIPEWEVEPLVLSIGLSKVRLLKNPAQ